ncbi:MAG TPA: hypothetical protein VF765_26380 [Polyangiaceae bacterium]
MERRFALAASVLALAALTGCVAPTTTYRYSAYAPAARPIPFDGRTAPAGSLHIEGTATNASVDVNDAPQIHDTALFIPRWTAEGAILLAVSSHVEVGLRGAYADYAWAQQSAVGTMPVPNAPASLGWGPEVRLSFPVDEQKRLSIGVAGNFMSYQVPYAEWTLVNAGVAATGNPPCSPSAATCDGYSLVDTKTESHTVYSVGVYPSYAFGDQGKYGHVFGLVDATNGFANDGFTNQASNGSTVTSVGPVWIVGGGYGIGYEWLKASALVYWPMTERSSPVEYGPGMMLTIGVNAPLWGGRAESTD